MSVLLATFKDKEYPTVELWAPDYDVERVWLCLEDDDADLDYRIDLSADQLWQLGLAIDHIIARKR